MMIKPMLVAFVFALLVSGCISDRANKFESYFALASDIEKEAFDRYLESKMHELKIPGLSIAVINKGKIVHHKTMGYASRESKIPVTEKSIFEGASMSKSVFAFFVMKYVEEGKIDLDKPLYEYVPNPDLAHDERYKKITARMVLSHRSGLPNWRQEDPDKILRIHFEPGSDYRYSGEGYQYLAMVLKNIEGTDSNGLEAAFQKKVAIPLQLEHTVFIQTPYTRINKAEPYDENGNLITLEKKAVEEFGAAYSIHSEPVDFSRWMIAVMNKELLSKDSYDELFKPYSTIQSDGPVNVFYSLGFMSPEFPIVETDIYSHSGHNDGFTCMYVLDTEEDWGFVVFTNSESGEPLGNELFEYLLLGPDLTKLYIIAGMIILLTGSVVGYGIRAIVRRVRRSDVV